MNGLNSSIITTTSSYFYGKLVARAARLALIAKEMSYLDMIPKVSKFLKETVEHGWSRNLMRMEGIKRAQVKL